MKHALLVGVPDMGRQDGLRPAPNLVMMKDLLRDLGGWTVSECSGDATRREDVLRALDAMLDACGPEDTCLFYFFGHGGVVRFSGLAGDLGRRPVFYLATLRPEGSPRVGVLDVEISAALSRLDQICGNVTAILDCCHAASIVRDGEIPTITPPAWVAALDLQKEARDHLLAVESHPRIVRLFGSSSLRSAYAQRRPDGHHGRLTKGFVQVLREAELRCDRLSWDAVAHRVREQTSLSLGTEDQRVVLAGPRQRLLFSQRTTTLPRSTAYMPGEEAGRGWLRAGLLQGVEVGDRWGIAALTLGDDLEPRFITDAEVQRVELDRCEVTLLSSLPPQVPAGTSALLRGFERRMPVAVEASSSVMSAIEASGLLRAVPIDMPEVIARIREQPQSPSSSLSVHTPTLELCDADGHVLWERAPAYDAGLREVIELLEDRARAQRLVGALQANASTAARETTLYWRWGMIGRHEDPIELTGHDGMPRVHVGDRLWMQIGHRGFPPPHWFVSVVEIGVAGRPQLLNAHEPEGMEVGPGNSFYVGLRGHRKQQGLPLHWPSRVPPRGSRPSTLLMIASQRPIALGHLVRTPHPQDPAAFLAQGMLAEPYESTRGASSTPPVASPAWTWGRIDFELDPHRR
jgi:hypothetical protein